MIQIRGRKNVASRQILDITSTSALLEINTTHELLDQLPLNEENWAERWCTLPIGMKLVYEQLFNFEVRDDDVFLLGFIKSGNTWLNEVLWQLVKGLDLNNTKTPADGIRRFFLEYNGYFSGQEDRISVFEKSPGPRVMQTHFPANLLPKQYWEKKPKTIYVARNVKDVVISSYHFNKGLGSFSGTMDEFVQDFMNHEISYTPYWTHIVDFWKLRNETYIFFITYEEMKRDLAGVIKKLGVFLEIPSLTESELNALLDHLSFERMTDNKELNPTTRVKKMIPNEVDPNFKFMRRGIIGAYKDELSVENQNLLNDWSRSFLAKHGIKEEDIFGSI